MKKKLYIIAGTVLAIGLGALLAIPVLENQIHSSLEEMSLDTRIQEELESTGLRLTYQGKRFEIFHGLILKGARLEKEQNGSYVEVADFRDMVLSISYFSWATGGQPLSSIRSYNGRLYSDTLLTHKAGSFLEDLRDLLGNRDLDVGLYNIAWETASNSSQSGIRADLELKPEKDGLNLDFRFYGESGEIRFHGTLNNQDRRIYITLSEVPVQLLLDFMRTSDSVPALQLLPAWSTIRGELNGKGSMDLRQPGTAINLKGGFHSLHMDAGEPFALRLRNLEGDYHFSQVHSYEEGVLKSDIEIKAGDVLDTRLAYKKESSGLPHSLHLEGQATLSDLRNNLDTAIFTTLLHCAGQTRFSIDARYNESLTRIDLVPDVKLEDFKLLPPDGWPGQKEALANLSVHVDGARQRITGQGTVLDGKVSLDSKGKFSLARIEGGKLRLVQDIDHSMKVDGVSYRKLTELLVHTHSWILDRASRPDARKAEDQGPLWENEFIDMPLYTQILAGLQLDGQVSFVNMAQGTGLPDKATMRIASNPMNFNLSLSEDPGQPGVLRARYMGVWNEQLPSHTLSLNIKQKELSIHWPELTGQKGPSGISIDANFSSSGLYPADLMNYSNGQMYFKAYDMDMKAFAPFALGMKMLGKKIPDGPVIGDIEVVRSGTGQQIEYYRIVMETDTIVARGGGSYTIYEGGKTWLDVAFDGNRDKLNFQVQKNGKWLPDDGL